MADSGHRLPQMVLEGLPDALGFGGLPREIQVRCGAAVGSRPKPEDLLFILTPGL
jgi:hypothetical protein